MVTGDRARLTSLLGTPQTARLLARLRSRLESTGELVGSIVLQNASSEERTAAARLLGKPVRAGNTASVSLVDLDDLLKRAEIWPSGLADAVVTLTGSVTLPEGRSAEREAWQRANDLIHEVTVERPHLLEWAESLGRSGALRRATVDSTDALRVAALLGKIADALPAADESLGVFAARVVGDAHGLDNGEPLGTLATGLAAAHGKVESTADGRSARWRRDAWQSVGVVVDELSSTVLALNLPGGAASPTARALEIYASSGQPALLTLRQLVQDEVGEIPLDVFVCENPAVVAAAADRWGRQSAPLVCVNGQPGGAVIRLLEQLAEGGAKLHYHGDFDAGGISIARTLRRHVKWHPWRFDSASYGAAALPDHPPIRGSIGETSWDPLLATTMATIGRKVEEEHVLSSLLDDLAPLEVPRRSADISHLPIPLDGDRT